MVSEDRLNEIHNELSNAPDFFKRLRWLLVNAGEEDREICDDLAAAPEFFEEIKDVVKELLERRKIVYAITDYSSEVRGMVTPNMYW